MHLTSFRLPSFHSIHWKVFIFHLVVMFVPMLFVASRIKSSLEKSYLHSTEAGMIDTAAVISERYGRIIAENRDDPANLRGAFTDLGRTLESTSFLKQWIFKFDDADVDTYFILYDENGHIVYDSRPTPDIGADYSKRKDVAGALRGNYGARWELVKGSERVYLYSTLPVSIDGRVAGVVSVVKPTNRIRNFIASSLWKLALPAFAAVLFAAGLAYLLSAYITRVIKDLAARARRVAEGESNVELGTWTRSELGDLARAIDRMRRTLEGKAYVEETVANLSHELKTPLAAIRGAAELLEQIPPENTAARTKFLNNIQTEVRRLDKIVGNMLMLARIDSTPSAAPVPVIDVAGVLREECGPLQAEAAEFEITFECEIPERPVPVRIPEFHFLQLVRNLVQNACNFTPAGGTVEVRLSVKSQLVFFEVSDSGSGIEPDLVPKIWDRFFTTDNPRSGGRGTGLGLAIVRSIVTSFRGEVLVESAPGRGSTFRVRFPLAMAPAEN